MLHIAKKQTPAECKAEHDMYEVADSSGVRHDEDEIIFADWRSHFRTLGQTDPYSALYVAPKNAAMASIRRPYLAELIKDEWLDLFKKEALTNLKAAHFLAHSALKECTGLDTYVEGVVDDIKELANQFGWSDIAQEAEERKNPHQQPGPRIGYNGDVEKSIAIIGDGNPGSTVALTKIAKAWPLLNPDAVVDTRVAGGAAFDIVYFADKIGLHDSKAHTLFDGICKGDAERAATIIYGTFKGFLAAHTLHQEIENYRATQTHELDIDSICRAVQSRTLGFVKLVPDETDAKDAALFRKRFNLDKS